MIGTGRVISQRLRRPLTEERRPGILYPRDNSSRLRSHDLQMLGSYPVCDIYGNIETLCLYDRPITTERFLCDLAPLQAFELDPELTLHPFNKSIGRRQ